LSLLSTAAGLRPRARKVILNHTAEVNAYVSQRQTEAAAHQEGSRTILRSSGVRARLIARRHRPRRTSPQGGLDILRAQDVGLSETDDSDVLLWAAREQRVVLTHEVKTMIEFAMQRIRAVLDPKELLVTAGYRAIGLSGKHESTPAGR